VSEAQFRRLSVGGGVDVVFLLGRPDISMLEINLVAASRDPWEPLEVASATIALVAVAGGLAFVWYYWRERRFLRWGRHTAATVTAVWTVNRGRYVITQARFEFQDSAGITRQGLARHVGKVSQKIVGPATRSYAAVAASLTCILRTYFESIAVIYL
jgi:hypothetical protein